MSMWIADQLTINYILMSIAWYLQDMKIALEIRVSKDRDNHT